MNIIYHIQDGYLNLLNAKLRSLLALLGILVGTAAVVAMVSTGELATNEALKEFKSLGTDLLAVSVNSNAENPTHTASEENLSLSMMQGLLTAHPAILDLAPYTQSYEKILFNGHELSGTLIGVTDSFARVLHIQITSGRFISILDGYQFYAVLGNDLYQQIKQFTLLDPIGQQIQAGQNYFTVIGVAGPWLENSFVYTDINNAVMIPIAAALTLSKYTLINNIIFKLRPDADLNGVQTALDQAINHAVSGKQLYFRSAKELIASMAKQSQIFTLIIGLIGSISLIVGGIGVMNIMLVSVVERRREIGIRLAVGAKRRDIGLLFLTEAVMLTLFGGALGVLLGIVITYGLSTFWHWQFIFFFLPPLIGFTVSCAIGIFSGFYPALKAARLNPIEALRAE